MMRWFRLIVITAGLSLAHPALCLDPDRSISQFAHTAWRIQDGFDVGASIAQTPDGYLWLGTPTGLLRFDGVRFTPYKLPLIDPPVRNVNYLLGARDGSLWIGTTIGLARLKDGKLQWFSDIAQDSGVSVILEDPEGTIWLTRYRAPKGEGTLCRVEGSGLHCYGEADGIRGTFGYGLTQDDEGNLWFGSSVLTRWRPGAHAAAYLDQVAKRSGAGPGIHGVAAGEGGAIWATTHAAGPGLGVFWFSKGKWANYVVPGFDGSKVGSDTLFIDREHTLWIGTTTDGLYRVHDGVAEHFSIADGLSGREVDLVFEDHEGNIWVATDGGIDMFRDTAVVSYTEREGLSATWIDAVLARRDGSLWIADGYVIDILKDGHHSSLPAKGRFDERVGALFEDPHGVVWIGRGNKLFSYTQGKYREIKGPDGSSLAYGAISAITQGSEGTLWIMTQRHDLLRVENGHAKWVLKKTDSNVDGGELAADHSGGLWIASRTTDTFSYYRDGAVHTVSLNHPEASFTLSSIAVDSDDALIVLSSQGFFRWDGKLWRGLDSHDGLPGGAVFSFLRDEDNAVWIRCQQGLVQIVKSEFDKWLQTGTKPVMTVFDRLDGASPYRTRMVQPPAARTVDGRLWFAARFSLQMIDPKRTFRNLIPPPVYVEKIIADHRDYGLTEDLRLPALTRDVRIEYTALSLTVPQKVYFRYRLEDHDTEWQDAGSRREVFYNDLPPGNYRFRVVASNNSGAWNEMGASLDFSIAPAYYQTYWFRAFCIVVFFALLGTIYGLRIRQLRNRERRFREAVETMPALAFIAMPDGQPIFVNERWTEYTGLTQEQALGSGWKAVIHPEDLSRVLRVWKEAPLSINSLEYESRWRRGADGDYRWFLTRAVPVRDKPGTIEKWYGVINDIEDRKRAEQLQTDLAHINRLSVMGEMAASLAHEIKQPISAATTNAQISLWLLERDQLEIQELREAISAVMQSVKRAADIIDHVRSLSKKGTQDRVLVDLNQVIREIEPLLEYESRPSSVAIRLNLSEHIPQVSGDRVQLQQVVMNLMLNAIEAMKDSGGELVVSSEQTDNGQVLISLSDTGVGLPDNKEDRIFEAFFSTKPQGTGMGLAISRSIVESHGGRLWAKGNPERGATFYFELPPHESETA